MRNLNKNKEQKMDYFKMGNRQEQARKKRLQKEAMKEAEVKRLEQEKLWLSERKPLINSLKENSQDLLATYLEKTEAWAKEQVVRNIAKRNEFGSWYRNNNWETDKADYYKLEKFIYTTPSWHFDESEFLTRSLEKAKAHFENSIVKLAYRIVAKGLDINNLQFKNSRVGINIDTIISDGEKQVKAQTICAWGEIQRPHYRYLIK